MADERWDPFKRSLEDSRRDLLKRLEEIESLGDLVIGVEWLPQAVASALSATPGRARR